MRSRVRTVAYALATVLLFVAAGSPAGASSSPASLHRWALCPKGVDTRGYSHAVLCATENGGKTWRPIFYGGNYIFAAVRTSLEAGVLSTGAYGHGEWWTRDNGLHWYPTGVIGGSGAYGEPGPRIVGSGNRLYWSRSLGPTIYQVEGWPPTGEITCPGGWIDALGGDGQRGDWSERRNLCVGPAGDPGMRSVPVLSVEDAGLMLSPRLLPSGIAAVYYPDRRFGVTLGIRDGDATRVHELPKPDEKPDGRRPLDGRYPEAELSVSWPRLTLRVKWRTEDPRRPVRAGGSVQAVHRSTDGGRTFTSTIQPGWEWRWNLPRSFGEGAAVVRDGEIVLVGGRASSRVHAFKPETGRWRQLPRLPVRSHHPIAASAGGRIYVVGGLDRRGRPMRRAFVLEDGRWHALPQPPAPRAAGGAAVLGAKLYVVGGLSGSGLARDVMVFDLRRGRWSTVPGPRPRAYLSVAAVRGRIVAVGGRTGGLGTHTKHAEIYVSSLRRWRPLPPMPKAMSEGAAAAAGNLFVTVGGLAGNTYWSEASVYALNLATRRWTQLPDLAYPSHGLAAAFVRGRLYAMGGSDYGGRFPASPYSQFLEKRRFRGAP